jgi:GNAT superfamily N-acetyltransferase
MIGLQIRKGVRPDIEVIKTFDHSMKTSHVWQMQQSENNGEVVTRFIQTQLPREMRVVYPHSPEMLETNWGEFSSIFVGCVDQVPVGYITSNFYFSPDLIWVRDLVVDEIWRRKGIASQLIEALIAWAKERNINRIVLDMSSKNYPAISLVRKLKFEYSGFNDNYFTNRDIALFFTRDVGNRSRG